MCLFSIQLRKVMTEHYSPKSLQFYHSIFAILIFTRFSREYIMLYSSCRGNYKRKENHIFYSTTMSSGKYSCRKEACTHEAIQQKKMSLSDKMKMKLVTLVHRRAVVVQENCLCSVNHVLNNC